VSPTALPPVPAPPDDYNGPPLLVSGKGKKKLQIGSYGGVTVAYTHMLHRDGVLVGGEGAVLLEHRLSIGGAGYGFARSPEGPPAADGTARDYFTGYGGVVIRYAVYSDIPLYASLGVLIGGGGISLAPHHDGHHDYDHGDHPDAKGRGYFVAQPDLSAHVNVTRWLRLSLTGGYRIATAVEGFGYAAQDVSGGFFGGNIQAGWF